MIEKLEKYYQDGLLSKQTHPIHDLTIWNYSPKVQYDKLWDDITIQCRGLVTNSNGDIIARPFKKFFNYEEVSIHDTPDEEFEIFEKMDEQSKQSSSQHQAIADKITSIERWKWMVIGGAIVIGYVLAHLKLEKLF